MTDQPLEPFIKVFEFPDLDKDGNQEVWDGVPQVTNYHVGYFPPGEWASEHYVLDINDAHSLDIYPTTIDDYIALLQWAKEHQASLPKPAPEPETDPAEQEHQE